MSNGDRKPSHDETYFEPSFAYNCDIQEVAGENKTPLLSFMYSCVTTPIRRRLFMSLRAFARSCTPIKTGYAIVLRMAMAAITVSNSINVKPRKEFFVITRAVKTTL